MSSPSDEKTRVLLIDDEEEFTDLLKMNLERTGRFEVAVENISTSAIDTARSFKPQVILLDIVMPGIDGGDISSKLRHDPELCETPVIMVSALVSNDELADNEVAQSGENIILAKPVQLQKLITCIDQALAGGL